MPRLSLHPSLAQHWSFALSTLLLFSLAVGLHAQTLNLPPRPASAPTGRQFINIVSGMSLTDRDNWIYLQVTNGNVPDFLRTLVAVHANGNVNGTNHTATYYATPDYVAIGNDADYFLEPMTPLLGQRLCDTLSC